MRKILEHCPSCGGQMAVTRMNCTECDTVVLSQYEPCRFCRLPPESLSFLEAFVKGRGNVKEMERELGESYWVIRNRISELLRELGFEVAADESDEADGPSVRRGILEQLDQGEISASQATEMLAKLDAAD